MADQNNKNVDTLAQEITLKIVGKVNYVSSFYGWVHLFSVLS